MPRRAPPIEAVAPIDSLLPPPPPSPIVQKLRTDWRWAGISQFMNMFQGALGLIDWDIEELERDLDGDETRLIPDILAKLMLTLTYNRQINRDNAIEWLRKQYLSRDPETNPLGTLEEPRSWEVLGLSQKVTVLWDLCEWQMQDPTRFRALLQNEEETTWRVDPIGWDKSGNTYFLFDDNRLWIQRLPPAPPRPPKKSSLKAKRALKRSRPRPSASSEPRPKKSHRKRTPPPVATSPSPPPVEEPLSGQRRRTQVQFYGNPTPTAQALKRGGPAPDLRSPQTAKVTRSSARHSAGGLEVSPRVETPTRPPNRGTAQNRVRGKGKTRAGDEDEEGDSDLSELTDEDEHEKVLQAVIKSSPQQSSTRSALKIETVENKAAEQESDKEELTPLSDSEPPSALTPVKSSLSEPPEDVDVKEEQDDGVRPKSETVAEEEDGDVEMADADDDEDQDMDVIKLAIKEAANLPEGFVEWEAICVTLFDWRTFPSQFAKSRDPDEKALHRVLTDQVGPTVIEALIAKEQERLRQEAINNRKRSSRIAMRESEREEQLRKERADRDMVDRMEKARREEARAEREEAEAIAREKAREDRLKERELRAQAREDAVVQRLAAEQHAKDKAERARLRRARRREGEIVETSSDSEGEGGRSRAVSSKRSRANGTSSAAPSPAPTPAIAARPVGKPADKAADKAEKEHWELNCEVCRKHGWDIDGDDDLVCCEDCGKWQHVECHDRQDVQEGRPRRNWEKVDFKCRECRRKAARKRQRLSEQAQTQTPIATQSNGHSAPSQPPQRLPPPPSNEYLQRPPAQARPPTLQPGTPQQVVHAPSDAQRPLGAAPTSAPHYHDVNPQQHPPHQRPLPQAHPAAHFAPMPLQYRPPYPSQYPGNSPHQSNHPAPQMHQAFHPHPQAPLSHAQPPYPAYRPQVPPQQVMPPQGPYPTPGVNGQGFPPMPPHGYSPVPPQQGYQHPQMHPLHPPPNRPAHSPGQYAYDPRAPRQPGPPPQQAPLYMHHGHPHQVQHSPYTQGQVIPRRQSDQGMARPPDSSDPSPRSQIDQSPSLRTAAPSPHEHGQHALLSQPRPTGQAPQSAAYHHQPSAAPVPSRSQHSAPSANHLPANQSAPQAPKTAQTADQAGSVPSTAPQRGPEQEEAVAALTKLAGGA